MEAVAGWVLLGTGVPLLAGLVLVRRPVPDRSAVPVLPAHLARWAELHGDIDPNANPLVRRWLSLVHLLARGPARAGFSPDLISLLALWFAGAAAMTGIAGGRWPLLGAAAVVAAGLFDGLDGAVAILAARVSRHGRILDGVGDRLADALLLGGFVAVGGSPWVALGSAVAIGGLETTRLLALRSGRIGRLTPGERPTRLILAGLGMIAAGAAPGDAAVVGTVALGATAAVVGFSWALLLAELLADVRAGATPPGR